ncbi:MAG: DUF6105 family protein [Phyllobacterium sp.]
MRYILIFWAAPMSLFWGWYFLSFYDINMGMLFFSREIHDLVFKIYGDTLGIAPESIPPLAARACAIDSVIIFGILAFRRRRAIASWYRSRISGRLGGLTPLAPAAGQVHPAE